MDTLAAAPAVRAARGWTPSWPSPPTTRQAARGELVELKADPGRASLETLLGEIGELERVRALGPPADLFDDAPEQP